jgi:hypothetical protein
VTSCKKLRVLYLANNWVREWPEVAKLHECPNLEEMVLQGTILRKDNLQKGVMIEKCRMILGNPLEEKYISAGNTAAEWQREVSKKILSLRKLDGVTIIRTDDQEETG